MSVNPGRFGTFKRIEGMLSMVTEVSVFPVGVAYLSKTPEVASGLCVSGAGGCSFLLHLGQSEQLHSLQHSSAAAVQVNHGGGGA